MLYTTLVIREKEYKLRLSAKSCVALEKRLGGNPLNVFMQIEDGKLPTLETLLTMLHQSLTEFQHGLTMDDVYGIYDDYCLEGGNMMSLIQVLLQVFKDAGFLPKDEDEEDESEKNF